MKVTQRLAEFVAGTSSEAIGDEARERAMRAVVDTLGVMLAGCREPAARLVTDQVREQGGRQEATVIGAGFHAPAPQAALANGTAAHALDYDDVTMNMRGHPSAPMLPALLAFGEKLGSSGRDILDAYVLGFEVECKLGWAIGEPHYALGWHATSTLGTVGAAAAVTRLLGFTAGQTQTALEIAASLASGLQANFGTMTKPLHAGWAARNGVLAADLASRGFDASADALEGPSGFLRAMSGGADIDMEAAVRGLGDPWEVVKPGIGIKLYPCCYATHRAIDAALEVRRLAGFNTQRIEAVEVHLSQGTLLPLVARMPQTGLEAKFSMGYCVAVALVHGAPGRSAFTDEAVARTSVRALAQRVRAMEDGPDMAYPIEGSARIVVTAGGASFEATVERPRGDPKNPLTWEELAGKFRDCAAFVLGAERIEEVIALCYRIHDLPNISELTDTMSTSEP
ncbi:MAG TPA: MmgE/PrpD family protein [Dehalococcoidia bacterium]|nr:MmgE/PrpD family protein [Dehalococcoidia bacterium]